jgi:hypothetical protein
MVKQHKNKGVDKLLLEVLESPVAFHRIYAKITGSINAGLLLSQLCYWDRKMQRVFWKTNADFANELGMSTWEFKTAKAMLVKAGFITVTRRGVPATSHYKVNKSAVLAQISSWLESNQQDGGNPTNKMGEIQPTITETNKPKTKDYSENTLKEKISSEELLGLDLKISKNSKLFLEEVDKILRPNYESAVTFASITKFLIEECQAMRLGPEIFIEAIEWAEKAANSRTATNPCGLFTSIVKENTGFKRQELLLRNKKS